MIIPKGLTPLNKEAVEVFEQFLKKLSLSKEEEGDRNMYFEVKGYKAPLGVSELGYAKEGIASYAIALYGIMNGDLMYIPEYTLFAEEQENGEKVYYIGEYIHHGEIVADESGELYQRHIHFIEVGKSGIEIINTQENKAMTMEFERFLLGLRECGYLDTEKISFCWSDTKYCKDYYNKG